MGQTGQSLVWANGIQKFRTGKFRLPFVEISSIYQKTTERPETGIKNGFEEIEHNFPLEYSVQKNRTTF